MKFDDAYTQRAVEGWSAAKGAAWRGRQANPNECLYRLPAPGARQALGPFTAAEAAAFNLRVAEFESHSWPLSCWGLFSLALPNRVGYQCSAHFKKEHSAAAAAAAARGKPSAAAVTACQQGLAAQVQAAFGTPAARRIAAAVDRWLAGAVSGPDLAPKASGQQQQQQQQQQSSGRRHGPAQGGSGESSDSDFEVGPLVASRGSSRQPAKKQAGRQRAAESVAAGSMQQRQTGLVGASRHVQLGSGILADSSQQQQQEPLAGRQQQQQEPLAGRQQQQQQEPLADRQQQLQQLQQPARQQQLPTPARQQQQHHQLPPGRQQPQRPPAVKLQQQQPQRPPAVKQQQQQRPLAVKQQQAQPQRPPAVEQQQQERPLAVEQQQQQQRPSAANQVQQHPLQQPQPAIGAAAPLKQQCAGQKRQQLPACPGGGRPVASKKSRLGQPAAPCQEQQQQQGPKQQLLQPGPALGPTNGGSGSSSSSSSSSSDDEDAFIAGSLRQAPVAEPKVAAAAAVPPAGAGRKAGGRTRAGAGAAASAAAAQPGTFGERVGVIRLDSTDPSRWPGWQASTAGIRQVTPYQPARPPAEQAGAPAGSDPGSQQQQQQPPPQQQQQPPPQQQAPAVVTTPDLLSYDLAQLGGGFQGVLLQLGDALAGLRPGSSTAPGSDSSGGGGSSSSGLTWERLAGLQLGDSVMRSGLLFVWAGKGQVAPAVRFMARAGAKYVENLTWVQLGPNNQPLQRPSALFNCSHATLLMGRRGDEKKEHLELRHQRTPDVIASPALRTGQCPEAVYSMIETLLPDGGSAAKSGGRPRLLELTFQPGREICHSRPGWVTVVHSGAARTSIA